MHEPLLSTSYLIILIVFVDVGVLLQASSGCAKLSVQNGVLLVIFCSCVLIVIGR